MKYTNKIILAVLMLGLFMVSCNKDDVNEGKPNNEKTIFKLPQASSDLASVAIDLAPGDVADYNAAHGTNYQELTFTSTPETPFDGTTFSVPFGSGDFVKFVKIKVNPSALDFTKKYAIGFSITDAGSAAISNGLRDVVVEVAIKNAYHGTYSAVGVFNHPTAGPRPIDELKLLATTGPNSVVANLGDLGGAGYRMILTVNPDNSVTITPNGVTPNIDQSWGPNYYDPATKQFHLHYSYNTAAPRIVEETLTPQ
jgi:hypothetical protein